jgi:GGDEF domain-containing protein
VIAITSYEEESAALGLVRMGAQDYLIENEIDCDPLARVLRCAVERSRLNWSRQSVSMVDDLTGLYNARGVALLTERDERLAASLDLCRWSVELRLDPDEAADSDLMRLELAEQLSEFSGAGLLAGRAGDDTFVVFGLAASGAAARDAAARVSERLNAARWSLCENR